MCCFIVNYQLFYVLIDVSFQIFELLLCACSQLLLLLNFEYEFLNFVLVGFSAQSL